MSFFRKLLLVSGAFITLAFAQQSKAAWLGADGLWYSNVCVSTYGYWIYPPAWARPVGTMCSLPNGTPGVVE